jgi:hypothetical protein
MKVHCEQVFHLQGACKQKYVEVRLEPLNFAVKCKIFLGTFNYSSERSARGRNVNRLQVEQEMSTSDTRALGDSKLVIDFLNRHNDIRSTHYLQITITDRFLTVSLKFRWYSEMCCVR